MQTTEITRTLELDYETAVLRTREALQSEGFGVLTEIDVRRTLKEKLGAELEPYVILGACNPPLAHKALEANPDVGLLLPCNVVVRQKGRQSIVAAMDPYLMMSVLPPHPALEAVASEAKTRLERAIGKI